ncbi:MAG: HrgA protein, partial [Rhodocyclaceae bacterium]|nr:HrgA protein [Rhodocyclaceae bacterium]
MAKQLIVRQTVFEYLKNNAGRKFTAQQIAEWMFETYPDECKEKGRRNNWNLDKAELVQHLVTVIGRNRYKIQRKYPQIKITADRPRRYYYSTQSDEDEVAHVEAGRGDTYATYASASQKPSQRCEEQNLYPLLAQYLWGEFGIFSMRIDEKKSSNRRGEDGNRWLHPDIVGMEDLSVDWRTEVRECASAYPDQRASVWSFEVKPRLNRSNVRMSFFQTLSNSSWANFAYLVAPEIRDDAMKELRMLSAAHGIGLMRLDKENPYESEVLIPARKRDAVDWDMVNRLAVENGDF